MAPHRLRPLFSQRCFAAFRFPKPPGTPLSMTAGVPPRWGSFSFLPGPGKSTSRLSSELFLLCKFHPRPALCRFGDGVGEKLRLQAIVEVGNINVLLPCSVHHFAQGGDHPLFETVADIEAAGRELVDDLDGVSPLLGPFPRRCADFGNERETRVKTSHRRGARPHIFRGARASRVLAMAFRHRELPHASNVGSARHHSARRGKFVSAGRQNQHAGRARSPEAYATSRRSPREQGPARSREE